jgi:pimeloyl-ACP methyl ester carboxylesterase
MSLAPMIRIAGRGFLRGRIRAGLIAASGDTSWVTDEVIRGYTAGATADFGATLRAFMRMAESREPARLAPRLRELRCPVVLLTGGASHDGGPRPAEIELLRASVASFELVTAQGAGHYVQEERPEVVVEAVERVRAIGVAVGS